MKFRICKLLFPPLLNFGAVRVSLPAGRRGWGYSGLRFCIWGFVFLCAFVGKNLNPFKPNSSLVKKLRVTPFLFFSVLLLTHTLSVAQNLVIERVIVIGNKVTKYNIISREFSFKEADTLSPSALDKAIELTKQNLNNTSLFNFININKQIIDSNKVYLLIEVTERWYIFPVPIFEVVDRNFNEWWLRKDLSRTNYGFFLNWDNFRGRKENVRLLLRFGYSQRLSLNYSIPYIDKKQKNGLSFLLQYSRSKEVNYTLNESKTVFYKEPDNYIRKEFIGGARWNYRRGIYKTFSITSEYLNYEISNSVLQLNPSYFNTGSTLSEYFHVAAEYKDDHRDYKSYPLTGYFFNVELNKNGFGNFKSDPNLFYSIIHAKKFFKISQRWHTAHSAKFKLSNKKTVPFFYQNALGYGGDLLRGYEYYVINGENYALFKSGIKFTIIKPKVFEIKQVPVQKFNKIPYSLYVNLFSDAGYVQDKRFPSTNPLANQWLYSLGTGLDFVTYYDLVIRIDYAFNKQKEHGIFLHLTAPI